tara:strand:- start:2543 stop:2716 length:174 start_codon:yes stop_codon:yes gene_type:complete
MVSFAEDKTKYIIQPLSKNISKRNLRNCKRGKIKIYEFLKTSNETFFKCIKSRGAWL